MFPSMPKATPKHKPHKVIKIKHLGTLSSDVIILHDKKQSHVAKLCIEALARKMWEVLEHPAYSLDLSPCDYQIFRLLLESLTVNRFIPMMT
ncbi:hypothetical protein TNCV_3087171 [Trichonephila clavipes]|nr:hypothetical protein TNCV_3087171 [Trichonephila clavipes]